MSIAASLLLTTLVTAGAQSAPADTPAAKPAQTQTQSEPTPPSTPVENPHTIGVGGFGGSGMGPSFRYFMGEFVGFEMNAGWYRTGPYGGSGRSTTFQAAPSVVVMLNRSRKMADVDVRPYVGGGINYMHSTTPFLTSFTGSVSSGGMGYQAFGGVEMKFAAASSLAISAEVRHYHLPLPTYLTSLGNNTNFYLLFHYYMK